MRNLAWFQGYDLFTTAVTLSLGLLGHNNLWFANLDEPVAFIWLMVLFRSWTTHPRARACYGFAIVLGLITSAAGIALNQSIFKFNDLFLTFQSLILSAASMFELGRLFMAPDQESPLTQVPLFWVLSGTYFFSLGSLVIHALGNHFVRTLPLHLVGIPWLLRAILYYLQKLMIAKAFLCPKPTSS